jgi:hypothetical protein
MELEEINNRYTYIENRVRQIYRELKTVTDEVEIRTLQKEMGELTYEKCITLSEEAKSHGYVFYRYENKWQVPGISEDRIHELVKQYLIGYGPNTGDCEVCDKYENGICKPRGMSKYSFDLCPIVEEKMKEIL